MNCYTTIEQYENQDTFEKIRKSPKPIDEFNPKGKKKNKKDYSKERNRKRESLE